VLYLTGRNSGDAHGSEYVAKDDRRQGFIRSAQFLNAKYHANAINSGFSGESSTAIVSQTSACLFVDGRYHVSAGKEIDQNWHLYKVGVEGVPTWTEYLKVCMFKDYVTQPLNFRSETPKRYTRRT
jgi:Xaa-Pro aminopeptidase